MYQWLSADFRNFWNCNAPTDYLQDQFMGLAHDVQRKFIVHVRKHVYPEAYQVRNWKSPCFGVRKISNYDFDISYG